MSDNSDIISYQEALARSMREIMAGNENSIIMGQGVGDPTAIFGTTKGLLEEFGEDRVIDTPICEDGTAGFSLGASLGGVYPIVTHIRVDFLILALNQIINMISKYRYMYGGTFEVPMLIRAVVGRSWGQGPQHSQSLQSLLGHIPGLMVLMPSNAKHVLQDYAEAANNYKGPVISIEHRYLYDMTFQCSDIEERKPFSASFVREGGDVTIVATSYMVQEAIHAANWAKENAGVEAEIIDLSRLSEIDHEIIMKSVKKTGKLIVADTSWLPYGVNAEICRGIASTDPSVLKSPVSQIGLAFSPCPTSHSLEQFFYPDVRKIVSELYRLTDNSGKKLPDDEYQKYLRKEFKGPF